jgi:hypothetical protein
MRILVIIGLSLVSLSAGAQEFRISGKVMDADSRQAIEYVSVYIDGSTKGTTSGSDGAFLLEDVMLPCKLVFSHVGYEVRSLLISDSGDTDKLRCYLEKRIIRIPEATVIHEQVRDAYLEAFRSSFLGKDYAEQKAEILNEEALHFIALDSGYEVVVSEPLEVLLPLNAYRIRIDLVHFSHLPNEDQYGYRTSFTGYYFFEELGAPGQREKRRIARHRVQTYYYTRLHFCRSWYRQKLDENGYVLRSREAYRGDASQPQSEVKDYEIWYENSPAGIPVMNISHFRKKQFILYYYHRSINKPVDLTSQFELRNKLSWSYLWILADTVRILPSGRVTENSLGFSREIGDKGVAWMLPEDYVPSMQ